MAADVATGSVLLGYDLVFMDVGSMLIDLKNEGSIKTMGGWFWFEVRIDDCKKVCRGGFLGIGFLGGREVLLWQQRKEVWERVEIGGLAPAGLGPKAFGAGIYTKDYKPCEKDLELMKEHVIEKVKSREGIE